MLINGDNLSKSFGVRTLFEGVSFNIEDKDRIGLVGANGTGKTTLIEILRGETSYDDGTLVRSKNLKLGYMKQQVTLGGEKTAYEVTLEGFHHLVDMEKELDEIAIAIEKGNADQKLLERQHVLREKYENMGGLTFRSKIKSALTGLGLCEEEQNLPMSSLSGGQRSKVSLAGLLVSDANLLLLDEPTNHLDISAIEWLESFLSTYRGAFIVISHDRYFLDKVTNRTFELQNERMAVFEGNYSTYLDFKEKKLEDDTKHYENQKKEIERLEQVVKQQRQWNREKSIKRAESKQKVIDKLEATLEKPEREEDTIYFSFKTELAGPNEMLVASDLGVSFDQKDLFSNVNLKIMRGERIFLMGINGSGKTTLLRQLMGQQNGTGVIRFGPGVNVGYYDQAQEGLTDSKTAFDEISDIRPDLTNTAIRNALAAFLFKGDDVFKKVGDLSGGERARVCILKLMLSGANFLILDEPTNHLDIGSREALETALMDYNGTLLMVSHDRYFINKLADRIYYLENGGVASYMGGYDDLNRALERIREQNIPEKKEKIVKPNDYKLRKEYESAKRKLKGAIERCEKALEEVALEICEVEEELSLPENSADFEKIMELTNSLDALQQKEIDLMEQWEQMSGEFEEKYSE